MSELPWAQTLREFASRLHWTPAQVLDGMTWAELYHVWFGGGTERLSAEEGADRLRDQINRRRAAKGLPPMKPQPKKTQPKKTKRGSP